MTNLVIGIGILVITNLATFLITKRFHSNNEAEFNDQIYNDLKQAEGLIKDVRGKLKGEIYYENNR